MLSFRLVFFLSSKHIIILVLNHEPHGQMEV
jgi:hypothetical protein